MGDSNKRKYYNTLAELQPKDRFTLSLFMNSICTDVFTDYLIY